MAAKKLRGGAVGTSVLDAMDILGEQGKIAYFDELHQEHKMLEKRQHQYKRALKKGLKYKSRNDTIIEKSYMQATERMRLEINDLRAQIWVANGITHERQNDLYLDEIQCHVNCQEKLSRVIQILKKDITNMERGIQNLNKKIYELNLKTVPDSQHQAHVANTRKKLALLENGMEMGIRQECSFISMNATMRNTIKNILFERGRFYKTYTKLMQTLNSDKKFLTELIESALGIFDNCIDAHDKIDFVQRKHKKENELRKTEAQSIVRNDIAVQVVEEFVNTKTVSRPLAELQPKEYRRRQSFVVRYQRRLEIYNKVLTKLLKYCKGNDFSEVIERFQQQESLYYSYFSFANEIGYHVTLLNNSVNRLYADVEHMKAIDMKTFSDQTNTIDKLEAELKQKKHLNRKLLAKRNADEESYSKLLANMNDIVKMCNLNILPLSDKFGDNSQIDHKNVRSFTKLLEDRVQQVVANVFNKERANMNAVHKYIVKDIVKSIEPQTEIENIVLTQQCPECAEGESFNVDEMGDSGVYVHSVNEAKHNLFDKVKQPEMQYRLHSISQCRLPRSRILASKRFNS